MICRVCKGSCKQTVIAFEITGKGSKKVPPIEIDCIWCNGTGEMTEEQSKFLDEYDNAWCRCEHSSGPYPYRDSNSAHGWKCNDCGKITQTG